MAAKDIFSATKKSGNDQSNLSNQNDNNHIFVFSALFLFWFSFITGCLAFFVGYILFSIIFFLISFVSLLLFYYFMPFKIFSPLKYFFGQIIDFIRSNSSLVAIWLTALFFYVIFLLGVVQMDWDWTKDNLFSLSDSSRKIARSLEHPIEILHFSLPGGEEYKEVQRVLKNFSDENKKIRVRFVDLSRSEAEANRLNVRSQGELVFLVGGKIAAKIFPSDLSFKKVSTWGKTETIFNYEKSIAQTFRSIRRQFFLKKSPQCVNFLLPYFLVKEFKFGETKNISQDFSKDWSSFSFLLRRFGFDVRFYLPRDLDLPKFLACDILVIDGRDFLPKKIIPSLRRFLFRGGRALILFDTHSHHVPQSLDTQGLLVHPLALLNFFGVQSGGGILVDKENISPYLSFLTSQTPAPRLPAYPHLLYQEHRITTFLKEQDLPPFFSGTVGFFVSRQGRANENVLGSDGSKSKKMYFSKIDPLVYPSPAAWSEMHYQKEMRKEGKPIFHPNVDHFKAKWVAAAFHFPLQKEQDKKAKVVLVGDAQFLSNRFIDIAGNKSFSLNIIRWLAGEKGDLGGDLKKKYWQPTAFNAAQEMLFFIFCIVIFPIFVFSLAIFVVVKRKMSLERFAQNKSIGEKKNQ